MSTPEPLELRQAPVDDADELRPSRHPDGQAELPAGFACCLEQGDRMAALGRNPRRFEAGRAGADHTITRRLPVVLRAIAVRHRRFAPGGRIVDAQRLIALIDPVEAVGRADAGADLAPPRPSRHLGGDMRVGDMGARHADHVELALGDGVAGGRHIVDAGGVEHREAGGGPDLAGEIEMRRRAHAGDRDHPRQRPVDARYDRG